MDDLIKRSDAINIAKNLILPLKGYEQNNQAVMNYEAELLKLPSASAPKSKWIEIEGWWTPLMLKCPICGKIIHEYSSNFCPNCGADMRGESDE